jgi:hypothetical protein
MIISPIRNPTTFKFTYNNNVSVVVGYVGLFSLKKKENIFVFKTNYVCTYI